MGHTVTHCSFYDKSCLQIFVSFFLLFIFFILFSFFKFSFGEGMGDEWEMMGDECTR